MTGKQIIRDLLQGVLPENMQRFTEKQLNYYATLGKDRYLRARCLAGAFLGLRTTAKEIEIKLGIKGRARNRLGLDLEVDGDIVQCFRLDLHEEKEIKVNFQLDLREKFHQVKLYLPVSVEVEILDFKPAGEPLPRPARKLLCLGDSITQGMEATSPGCSYPVVLARMLEMDLLNQGVGGQTFDAQTLDDRLPLSPELITVAYGFNDWNQDLTREQIRETSFSYLKKLRQFFPQSLIVVLTPLWAQEENKVKAAGTLQDVRNLIAESAKAAGCLCLPGVNLVPNHPFYFSDGVHPDETGHIIFGLNIFRYLSQYRR